MDWDRRRYSQNSHSRVGNDDVNQRRFDGRGESYRPVRSGRSRSRGYDNRPRRSPPRERERSRPPPRADTWVPGNRGYGRPRSRSPPAFRRRSRTPPFQRGYGGPNNYDRRRSPPRRFSPRRDSRARSPLASWQARSPSHARSSPKRNGDGTSGSQDLRGPRPIPTGPMSDRPRLVSPSLNQPPAGAPPPQSPVNAPPHREPLPEPNRDTAALQQRQPSPTRPSEKTGETKVTSNRPSPAPTTERENAAPPESAGRSRSPVLRTSNSQGLSLSRGVNGAQGPQVDEHAKGSEDSGRQSDNSEQQVPHRFNGNIPTQPRSLANTRSPPLGPSQGPRAPPSQPRGAQNWSTMSAPTRPRRGPGSVSREGPWNGPPTNRRGPPIGSVPTAPSGPRALFTPSGPAGASYRYSGPRQSTSFSGPSTPAPRAPNHLAGVASIIPGGRLLPSGLDPATEKRLLQLEADQEKLLEQMNELQRMKRSGLRDWDRLDRESIICAQKSELLDGHLQRLADQSMGGGYPF